MATYMMKYNPSGVAPSGATQLKTLAIATGTVNVSGGGWYGGVDDDGVYLITCDTTTLNFAGRSTGNRTGTAVANVPTVWKTTDRTQSSFLYLVNRLPGSPGQITDIQEALNWLDTNNFGVQPTYVNSGIITLDTTFDAIATGKVYIDSVQVLSENRIGTNQQTTSITDGQSFYASITASGRVTTFIDIVSDVRGPLFSDSTSGPITSDVIPWQAGETITITMSSIEL